MASSPVLTAAPPAGRVAELDLQRLERHVSSAVEGIWAKIDAFSHELPVDANDPGSRRISAFRIAEIEEEMKAVGNDIADLHALVARHAAEKTHDAAARVDALHSDVSLYAETFLVLLSDLYARARRVKSNREGGDAVWVPPETFERKTTKYWVRHADILRVKLEIIRNLPLLIFGRKQGAKEAAAPSSVNKNNHSKTKKLLFTTSEQEVLKDSQKISSVYFDTPELDVYHTRLMRHDGASLLRVRWYGERPPPRDAPDYACFVERKIHREFWTGEKSVKERCSVEQQYLTSVLFKGELPPTIQRGDAHASFLREVQAFLTKKGERQTAMVRTQYMRSAFQEATNNAVRISIDTDLKMIKELNNKKKNHKTNNQNTEGTRGDMEMSSDSDNDVANV